MRLLRCAILLLVPITLLTGTCSRAETSADALLRQLKPQGLVSDFAGVFAPEEKGRIESRLESVRRQTGIEIAIVTVRTMQGGEVDDFANRLFERWGIGQKGQDNGVLLFAAIEDRKARIEVGYGLEGVVNDALAGRILRQDVFPSFKRGDYAGGLERGVDALTQAVAPSRSGERPNVRREGKKAGPFRTILNILFLVAIVVFAIRHPFLAMLLLSGGRRGGGFGGGGFGGGGFGGFGGGMSGGGGASGGW